MTLIFVLEFKTNEILFKRSDLDQCLDYALDLKDFHQESQKFKIIPILIVPSAPYSRDSFEEYEDGVFIPLKCNKNNLNTVIVRLSQEFGSNYLY